MANQLTQHIAEAGTATMQTKIAYTAAAVTGTGSVLTFNEMIGAIGVIASIVLAGFTAWSNHKRNKLQIELIQHELQHARKRRASDG